MIKVTGKYNEAKIFTDHVDDLTLSQVKTMLDQSFIKDSQVRIMPDTHAGKGSVIGTSMTLTEAVVPNLVGVDIGCGLHVVELEKPQNNYDFKKLDRLIKQEIPVNFKVHKQAKKIISYDNVFVEINEERANKSIGTLGGGNHFIEINEGKHFDYLVIHSGSRNLGHTVATYYQKLAGQLMTEKMAEFKEELSQANSQTEREALEKELTYLSVPKDLAFLTGGEKENYLNDMGFAQRYAALNRKTMAEIILAGMNWQGRVTDSFDVPHNYIDLEQQILRKGATSAKKGERLIIPLNMKEGSLLAVGKGNPDWNYSAPHGAGRVLSRTQARAKISLIDYRKEMANVWTSSVSKKTLDEAPAAYKDSQQLRHDIVETAEIVEQIRPLYNFKG